MILYRYIGGGEGLLGLLTGANVWTKVLPLPAIHAMARGGSNVVSERLSEPYWYNFYHSKTQKKVRQTSTNSNHVYLPSKYKLLQMVILTDRPMRFTDQPTNLISCTDKPALCLIYRQLPQAYSAYAHTLSTRHRKICQMFVHTQFTLCLPIAARRRTKVTKH